MDASAPCIRGNVRGMTQANDQQDDKYGEPTHVAEVLHGDRARAEEHDQPATAALSGDTLIAEPGRAAGGEQAAGTADTATKHAAKDNPKK